MTWGRLPVETYELVRYAVQLPCFVCEGGNMCDAERCRHCHAPLDLARQVQRQKVPPQLVALFGAPNAGKTSYLGLLTDMLSRQVDRLQLLARGAFSVATQQATVAALSHGRFPPPTPLEPEQWQMMHCEVRTPASRRSLELILPDIPGAALVQEVDHPRSRALIRAFCVKSSSALLLVDGERVAAGDPEADFLAMKFVTHLAELGGSRRDSWANKPVALVFSKADHAEEAFDDPTAYAREHTPGLWRQCQQRLRQHAFFAASLAGAVETCLIDERLTPVPLRIEPRGLIEPFAWLVSRLTKTRL